MPEIPTTPEFNDQYLKVDLMLTHESEKERGRMTEQAHDNDENPMRIANANSILESL